MYEWIPMTFFFDYKTANGNHIHYYCEALSEERDYFKVADKGSDLFFLDDYPRSSLLSAMERGSLINGMVLDDLRDAVIDFYDDSAPDISCLI